MLPDQADSTVKFVVVDIETTGLDPDNHQILEIGVVLCNADLAILNTYNLVFPYVPLENELDPVVLEMHTKNGLLPLCERNTTLESMEGNPDWDYSLTQFLEMCNATGLPMCGSSVHFDRAFLKKYTPKFEGLFHYRNIDVSTIKNLAELWNEGAFKGRPEGDKQHRALPDCYDTIEELKYYRTTFLRTERDLDSAN